MHTQPYMYMYKNQTKSCARWGNARRCVSLISKQKLGTILLILALPGLPKPHDRRDSCAGIVSVPSHVYAKKVVA